MLLADFASRPKRRFELAGTPALLHMVRIDYDPEIVILSALRDAGIALSTLVRDAIRSEYERRLGHGAKRKPSSVVSEILSALPDEADVASAPSVDARDRRALRGHVQKRLRRQK